MEMLINAQDCIAGRLASLVAKELLKGKQVIIVNAEKAVVSGDPDYNVKKHKEKVDRGDPYHGPFYPTRPDMVLKRFVRGMLPKSPRGREALRKLKVFLAVPPELQESDLSTLAEARNELRSKYIDLGTLAVRVGTKKTW